jgi:hypothetical protein
MKVKSIVVSFALLLSSELMASDRVLYEETTHNIPKIGVESEVYLGDRMLIQGHGSWRECITPKRTHQKSSMGFTVTYKANEPMCKTKPKDKGYWPTYELVPNSPNTSVIWKAKRNKSSICAKLAMGFKGYCIKKLPEDAVVERVTFVYSDNTFQQSMEYAGRSGDILKFNYSEFTDGFAREAFTREFQVDLTDGNVAAYKGAIVEIIDATNVQIRYKVIRNFSSEL